MGLHQVGHRCPGLLPLRITPPGLHAAGYENQINRKFVRAKQCLQNMGSAQKQKEVLL